MEKIRRKTAPLFRVLSLMRLRASLLSHVTFELARNPIIWAKLEDEVGKLGSGLVDMKTIRSLIYVRYCLLEGERY